MPSRDDPDFTQTETGRERAKGPALKAWEQAKRQRWRAIALAVKAKLELVESGGRSFEQEFGLDLVLPDGRTVGQHLLPQIADGGDLPTALLLPASFDGRPS